MACRSLENQAGSDATWYPKTNLTATAVVRVAIDSVKGNCHGLADNDKRPIP